MTPIQLPAAPGYIFAFCVDKPPNGAPYSGNFELWSVRDMSQVCQGAVGDCGIVSKTSFTVPRDSKGPYAYINGVHGVNCPIAFGPWVVEFDPTQSQNSEAWYLDGNIQDSTDNLQWDIYTINGGYTFQKFGPGEWSCDAFKFAYDTPRSIH